jgi:hypothetical protein
MSGGIAIKSVGLALIAYALTALLLFGDILKPLAFATIWQDRLGAPVWQIFVLISFGLAAVIIFRLPASLTTLKPSIFVASSLMLSTIMITIYADTLRRMAFEKFHADAQFQHSFLQSVRQAPKEFQFYLHGAALKDCAVYAWSYRDMGFYILKANVVNNVVPGAWRARCSTFVTAGDPS